MYEGDKIYLIDPKVDDGSMETLPFTDRMEVMTDDELLENGLRFSAEQKVCITCEMALELLMDRIDDGRRKAIEALKDKFTFRQTVGPMYPGYLYRLVKAKNVKKLCISEKYMIKPFKGYYGTAVRAIDVGTDFMALRREEPALAG